LSNIEAFSKLPDVNFVDKDVETLLANMISDYEEAYFESTGQKKTLTPGDPIRIWIYSQALRIYTAYQLIDYSAKQNLLKYAEGDYLDNIGARIGVKRLEAKAAEATVRFTLSAVQSSAVSIPQGTRVSPGNNVYFATTQYAEIPAGSTYVDVKVECTETGTVGNGYTTGQINILVDPIQYIASVANLDTSQGGVDRESDDSLKERIFLKPESFSVAGPKDAYVFFTKEYNQSIEDVSVSSPSAGNIDVRFILKDGEIPDATIIQGVQDYLSDETRRPLTDNVTVQAPTQVNYDINITYYIRTADKDFVSSIQSKVDQAVEDYKKWQKSKIGRDINPSELIARVINAGAKRVEVTAPVYTAVSNTQVASDGITTVIYGGLEDE
jgi:phage-related baseplate assembly protein